MSIKQLQEKYKKGEITKAQYLAELAKLLEAKTIDQEDYDEAATFDPEADKPIYTQADVDGMIAKKAAQQVRKALKDAGVEVNADNKTLFAEVAKLAAVGAGKIKPVEGEEAEKLKKQAGRADIFQAENRTLKLENSLLKTVGKYNPVSLKPVIALLTSDYKSLIDVDEETGDVDMNSLNKAVKRLQLDEPTLFKTDDGDGKGGEGNNFRGKGPGGTGGAGDGDKGHDANKARALEMMGLNKKDETKK